MARYRVAFDGKWQGTFDDREDAIDWARAVGDTGRTVYVVKRRWWWSQLVAVYPESQARAGELIWAYRGGHGGS